MPNLLPHSAPKGHGLQLISCSAVVLSYVPPWQPQSLEVSVPRSLVVEPKGQGLPARWPASGQTSPTGQSSQDNSLAEKLPMPHVSQVVMPSTGWYMPGRQYVQSSALTRSMYFEDVPLEHGVSSADFGGQYVPALHGTGSVVPAGQ